MRSKLALNLESSILTALLFISVVALFLSDLLIVKDLVSKQLCVWNSGVSLGLFAQQFDPVKVLFIIALVSFLLLSGLSRNLTKYKKIYFAGLLGFFLGALGNLLHRMLYDAVCDYITIGSLPVFNFNDLLIAVSLFAIFIIWVINEKNIKN